MTPDILYEPMHTHTPRCTLTHTYSPIHTHNVAHILQPSPLLILLSFYYSQSLYVSHPQILASMFALPLYFFALMHSLMPSLSYHWFFVFISGVTTVSLSLSLSHFACPPPPLSCPPPIPLLWKIYKSRHSGIMSPSKALFILVNVFDSLAFLSFLSYNFYFLSLRIYSCMMSLLSHWRH